MNALVPRLPHLLFTVVISACCVDRLQAQVVNIPDENFKAVLVGDARINTNDDEEIQVSEAESFNGWMHIEGENITNLTGIEAFTFMEALVCSDNHLDTIDLSANTSLRSLWCSDNGLKYLKLNSEVEVLECRNNMLTSLDLSGSSSLRILHCNGNQLTSLDVTGHTDLFELICTDNQLTSLDVSTNPKLSKLLVGTNQLTSLDLTNNGSLGTLHCYQNQLTQLDVTNQPYLGELECNNNFLTDIDLSANRNLHHLNIYNNELSTLDVSKTLMINLWCSNNQLDSIVLGPEANLRTLRIAFNQLTELDLGEYVNLRNLDCRKNQLTSLDVQNGNNWNFTNFDARSNPDLSCIKVDDPAYAEANWTKVDAGVAFDEYCGEVNISDAHFRDLLLSNTAINTNGDDKISIEEAEGFTGYLDVSDQNIASLLGIETFTSLTGLDCSLNPLLKLDLHTNVSLTELDCHLGQLNSLNIRNGNNQNMTMFDATGNPDLTCIEVDDVAYAEANWSDNVDPQSSFSLDCIIDIPDPAFKEALVGNSSINTNGDDEIQVSEAEAFSGTMNVRSRGIMDLTGIERFTSLTELDCRFNALVMLDLSANTALTDVQCSVNNLTTLITGPGLLHLDCSSNQLTTLDIGGSPDLLSLTSHWNQLENVDVSANTELVSLHVGINQLTSLDVSHNTQLDYLHCGQNQLTSLDVSHNTNLTTLFCNYNQLDSFDISANPNLTFMVCNDNQLTSLNLKNGHNASLSDFSAIDNPDLTCVQVDDVERAKALWSDDVDEGVSFDTDCNYQPSPDVVYIPDPLFREYLVQNEAINTNGDEEIQLSEAEAFTGKIAVFSRQIADLTGIEAFTSLSELNCGANDLTSLDVSANTALRSLECFNNPINTLDVSANTELTVLRCFGNNLSTLDISANPYLERLECYDNNLTTLDISNQPNLVRLYCHFNQLNSLDVAIQTQLEWLYCFDNQLTTLNVQNNPALTKLRCDHNQITQLDVSNNPLLTDLECYVNELTSLDVSANPELSTLLCFGNQLTSLNIQNGSNESLTDFRARNNALSCVQVDDVEYAEANWSDDVDEGAFFSVNCNETTARVVTNYKNAPAIYPGLDQNEDGMILSDEAAQILLYPNPSSGMIHFQSDLDIDGVDVFSITGKRLGSAKYSGKALDISELGAGVYFIRVVQGKQVTTKRIVRQ